MKKRKYYEYHFLCMRPILVKECLDTCLGRLNDYRITLSNSTPFTKEEADSVIDDFVASRFRALCIQKGLWND